MSSFYVIFDKDLPGCLVAAQSTKVCLPYMNCLFVLGKIPL